MIIKFKPVLLEKVWGGKNLMKRYESDLKNIGEVWGISAHETYSTKIVNTEYAGYDLRRLYLEHREVFGELDLDEFPILFKVIDAADDLSVQVHPTDDYALKYENSNGKDECWYILETHSDNTEIIIGHNAKNKEELVEMIKSNKFEELINKFSIKPHDYFYIPSGKVHAICKDTTLLEVSQSSNVTYRLYDYNRLDNGKLRDLHIEQSINVITVPDSKLERVHNQKYFDYEIIKNTGKFKYQAHRYGDYFYLISGKGVINQELVEAGDFFMVSSFDDYMFDGDFSFARVRIN